MLLIGCRATRTIPWPALANQQAAGTGTAFYTQAAAYSWQQRDSLALAWLLAGQSPRWQSRFVKIKVQTTDSTTGKTIRGHYYASPDYISLGTHTQWARIPLTPMTAQRLADTLHCFLPTPTMVDAIYQQASHRPAPLPLFAFRDSTPTFYHHHLMIQGQLTMLYGTQRPRLVAGIKKDVVVTGALSQTTRPNRVAIYGWHQPNGTPIQPLYTGHVNWYVDYSHGIRLIYQTIWVNGRRMHYREVMQHPVYHRLLCKGIACNPWRYPER